MSTSKEVISKAKKLTLTLLGFIFVAIGIIGIVGIIGILGIIGKITPSLL